MEIIGAGISAAAMVFVAVVVWIALKKSSEVQTKVRVSLPSAVAQAVADELSRRMQPAQAAMEQASLASLRVSEALVNTQNSLSTALVTLNGNGALTEWVDGFQKVAHPIAEAGVSVEQHYATGQKLLESMGRLLGRWDAQSESVQFAFDEFSKLVKERSAKEQTTLSNIADHLYARLKSVSDTNQLLASKYDELKVSEQRTLTIVQELAQTMKELGARFADLESVNRQTQARHAEILQNQQRTQNELETFVKTIAAVQADSLEAARSATRELHAQMNALRQERIQSEQSSAELSTKMGQWIGAIQSQFRQLPSRTLQIASMAALSLQVIVLIAVLLRMM